MCPCSQKKLIGVLDLDSARLNRFGNADLQGLSEIARVLVRSSAARARFVILTVLIFASGEDSFVAEP